MSRLPPLHLYEEFVRREQRWYLPVLDTARSLSFFLPERITGSQFNSEALYSSLNLLSIYHDRILHRVNGPSAALMLKVQHADRHTRYMQNVLILLHFTSVMIEMLGTNLGDPKYRHLSGLLGLGQQTRWLFIGTVEMTKVIVRLQLLYANNGHMLLPRSAEEIEWDVLKSDSEQKKRAFARQLQGGKSAETLTQQQMRQLIATYIEHGRYGHPHGRYQLAVQQGASAERMTQFARPQLLASEVLNIIRPLVYVIGRLYYANEPRHSVKLWRPWLVSLMVDMLARATLPSFLTLTPQQRSEVIKRYMQLGLYLLRSPAFDRFTAHPLAQLSSTMSYVPIVGIVFSNITELIKIYQQYYFYVSAS